VEHASERRKVAEGGALRDILAWHQPLTPTVRANGTSRRSSVSILRSGSLQLILAVTAQKQTNAKRLRAAGGKKRPDTVANNKRLAALYS
jgi:hypothetical protein